MPFIRSGTGGMRKKSVKMSITKLIHTLIDVVLDTKKIVKEGYVALVFSVFTCFIPGIILGKLTGLLEYLPGLIILIPGAIATRGNIFSTLASRLSTRLHLGELSPAIKKNRILTDNVYVIITQTFVMALLLASFAKIISNAFGIHIMSFQKLAVIAVLGAIIAAPLLLIITIMVAFASFRRGLDPDNVSCPMITATGDALSLPSLIAAAYIVMMMPDRWVDAVFVIIIITAVFLILLGRGGLRSKILKESVPVLAVCAVINTMSGCVLESNLMNVVAYASVLVLLPSFNEEGGNMGGILAARFSSAMHLGMDEWMGWRYAVVNVVSIIILSLLIYPLLAITAYAFSVFIGITSLPIAKMVVLALGAGIFVALCSAVMGYYLTYISYKSGLDPDNIVIPIITCGADLISTATIVFLLTSLFL